MKTLVLAASPVSLEAAVTSDTHCLGFLSLPAALKGQATAGLRDSHGLYGVVRMSKPKLVDLAVRPSGSGADGSEMGTALVAS